MQLRESMMYLKDLRYRALHASIMAQPPTYPFTPSPAHPPRRFQTALQKAVDALEEWRMKQPLGSALRNAGHLLMSEVDKQGAHAMEKEASKLMDGGVEVLEKLHLKVRQKTETWKAMLYRAWSSVHGFSCCLRAGVVLDTATR